MPVVERVPSVATAADIGIVHLGLGAFHRAQQAVYLQRHHNRHGQGGWGLCSANLRSNSALVEQLRDQACTYHVAEYRDREQVTLRQINDKKATAREHLQEDFIAENKFFDLMFKKAFRAEEV